MTYTSVPNLVRPTTGIYLVAASAANRLQTFPKIHTVLHWLVAMGKPKVHDQLVDHMGCRAECKALESLGPMVFLVSLLINAMSV